MCTYHYIDPTVDTKTISIGVPMPSYQCLILDEFLQSVAIDQEGELLMSGVGVFAGYLGRDDLTEKALIEISGKVYYRTGDLVRMDYNGLLHYQGRKDHQIKLHGQRIELGEIERCLLNTSISACVVMKWGDDHLVAYVQSSEMNEEQLRQHCQSQLPPHMIPSIFMVLEKLPLNANGKIDRKLLPSPNISHFSTLHAGNHVELSAPTNEIEATIHQIWCDTFQQNRISINTNLFTIGGHSLLLMQLFHRYRNQFHLQTNTLSVADLFQHPTITDHAKLISQILDDASSNAEFAWTSLNITQGEKNTFLAMQSVISCLFVVAQVSSAQERIFLDEQIRFTSKNNHNMYLIPQLYHIPPSTNRVSISRLTRALEAVIRRHSILRTALYLDIDGIIVQHCLEATVANYVMKTVTCPSVINAASTNDHAMYETINDIISHPDLFDLSQARVIHGYIFQRDHLGDDGLLYETDYLLFCMHHSAFDGTSTSIFLRDLAFAYETDCSLPMNDNTLQYIDYAVHERLIDTTSDRQFWHSQLQGYNLQRSLTLPFDRRRSSTDQRSGLASSAQISFNRDTSTAFFNYASSHHLTPFQLGLTTFYAFLFQLTHGQNDLCIASINANRYRSELQQMIGMFVATLPYRMQLDSQWSFDELAQHVRGRCLSILEHSHYPLQRILGDAQLNQSNVIFLETMFDFITVTSDVDRFSLDGAHLKQMSVKQSHPVAKFDFSLTFTYNPTLNDNQLFCSFACSRDLFDNTTIALLSQRFQYLFDELFGNSPCVNLTGDRTISMNKLSIVLPEEAEEMKTTVFRRVVNIYNEGM